MKINADVSIPHSIKKSHSAKVLGYYLLAQEGPYTLGEMVERTGMSPNTTTTVLTEMENTGYIEEIKDGGDTKYRIVPKSVTM